MKYSCFLASTLSLFLLVGCGPSTANVKGKVLYGAKTVKFGELVIFGGDGVPKTTKIQRDGSYEITGVTSGKCKVTVSSPNPKDVVSGNRDDKSGPNPEDMANWFKLPPEFADVTKSPITIDLKSGENEKNIELPAANAR